MSAAVPRPAPPGRKRSRSIVCREDGEEEGLKQNNSNPIAELKRTKTDSELDSLALIPSDEAWPFDLGGLIDSACALGYGNDLKNYVPGKSVVLVCVLEHVDIHYRLLWCAPVDAALPQLLRISPILQPVLLCRASLTEPIIMHLRPSFPIVHAKGPPQNHFLKLGLLHPLGGGQHAMDALVLIDPRGRRRLVLPFGWGAGRHVQEGVGGTLVQERLMGILRDGVEKLSLESHELGPEV